MPQAITPRRPARVSRLWTLSSALRSSSGCLSVRCLYWTRALEGSSVHLRISRVGWRAFCGRCSRVTTPERLCASRVTSRTITGSASSSERSKASIIMS